jgi:hypothetical protein
LWQLLLLLLLLLLSLMRFRFGGGLFVAPVADTGQGRHGG